ncbi:TM2 domain-containing protein [Idiomarina seosinensis]|uniref:TM2 domain-containing protein n=1 Tax=Idiomarina seosinensis TaxID=281739 RepID=UPI00384F09B3
MNIEQLRDQEEALRNKIRKLTDEQRRGYYRQERRQLKDPDTFAVLNYFFIAGLHHFYLGNRLRGSINLLVMLIGLAMLPVFAPVGIVLLVGIFVVELPQLFKSQRIVYAHNLATMRQILSQVSKTDAL